MPQEEAAQTSVIVITSNTSAHDIQDALDKGQQITDLAQINQALRIAKDEQSELTAQYNSSPDFYEDAFWYDQYVYPLDRLVWDLEDLRNNALSDDDSDEDTEDL